MTRIRYRRRRSAKVLVYNPWNFDAEVGDLMVSDNGLLYRMEKSSSWWVNAAGELYARLVHPPRKDMKAVIDHGEIYWVNK